MTPLKLSALTPLHLHRGHIYWSLKVTLNNESGSVASDFNRGCET